jgi:hypothetical protein
MLFADRTRCVALLAVLFVVVVATNGQCPANSQPFNPVSGTTFWTSGQACTLVCSSTQCTFSGALVCLCDAGYRCEPNCCGGSPSTTSNQGYTNLLAAGSGQRCVAGITPLPPPALPPTVPSSPPGEPVSAPPESSIFVSGWILILLAMAVIVGCVALAIIALYHCLCSSQIQVVYLPLKGPINNTNAL